MIDPAILAKAKEGRGLTLAEQAALAAEVQRLQLAGHLGWRVHPRTETLMDLYCERCGRLHPYTAGQVERLVYVAIALENNARAELVMGRDVDDPYIGVRCLHDLLDLADDGRAYGKHVAFLQVRRRILSWEDRRQRNLAQHDPGEARGPFAAGRHGTVPP